MSIVLDATFLCPLKTENLVVFREINKVVPHTGLHSSKENNKFNGWPGSPKTLISKSVNLLLYTAAIIGSWQNLHLSKYFYILYFHCFNKWLSFWRMTLNLHGIPCWFSLPDFLLHAICHSSVLDVYNLVLKIQEKIFVLFTLSFERIRHWYQDVRVINT